MLIVLPYPDAVLSPNARVPRWRLIHAKRAAKRTAYWDAIDQLDSDTLRRVRTFNGKLPLAIRFYPPDGRRRDLDNAIASLKSAADGIASAIGIDDSRFIPTYEFCAPAAPGRVEIEIDEAVLRDAA